MGPFVRAEASTVAGKRSVTYYDEAGNAFTKIGGSRSWRNNNPGNTRNVSSAIGRDGGRFDIYPDEETGRKAKISVIRNKYGEYESILQMLKGRFDAQGNYINGTGYAPACDSNDPEGYADFIHSKTGLDVKGTKPKDLTDAQMGQLVEAMKIKEGWIPGTTQETLAGAAKAK